MSYRPAGIDADIARIFGHILESSLAEASKADTLRPESESSAARRESMRVNIERNPDALTNPKTVAQLPRSVKRLWPSLRPGEWFKFKKR